MIVRWFRQSEATLAVALLISFDLQAAPDRRIQPTQTAKQSSFPKKKERAASNLNKRYVQVIIMTRIISLNFM